MVRNSPCPNEGPNVVEGDPTRPSNLDEWQIASSHKVVNGPHADIQGRRCLPRSQQDGVDDPSKIRSPLLLSHHTDSQHSHHIGPITIYVARLGFPAFLRSASCPKSVTASEQWPLRPDSDGATACRIRGSSRPQPSDGCHQTETRKVRPSERPGTVRIVLQLRHCAGSH